MAGIDMSHEKKVIIAIIDSGINTEKSDLRLYVKKSTGYRINSENYIIEDKEMPPVYEHGTAVAMVIRHICPKVEFISINIFQNELVTDGRVMLHALQNAIIYKPDIIHMSIGTTNWRYFLCLKKLIYKARKNNILIVSATNNELKKSYPANMKHVVGVKGADFNNIYDCFYKSRFFYAPRDVKGIRDIGILTIEVSGTSMSAAYITGHFANLKLANYIKSNNSLEYCMRKSIKKN